MKLSNSTLDVLKNFANINQNILIEEGNVIRTISTMKNILGSATIAENFPKEFGIYDLNEFLGVLSLSKDSEIELDNDSFLSINGGKTKIKYFFSDPSIIVAPPKTFNAPPTNISFTVTKEVLATVMKAAAVMGLEDLVIDSNGMKVTDLKNVTSNEFTEELVYDGPEFNINYKIDNLKMIPGNYDVDVSTTSLVSHWKLQGNQIDYWIALEQTSGE